MASACCALGLLATTQVSGQAGTAAEPVTYVGKGIVDSEAHDGGLRPVVGSENIQVMRANRKHPSLAHELGWTYNHAPNITYWNGSFYLQYLSSPESEHTDSGETVLAVSKDGRSWEDLRILFPAYQAPEGVEYTKGSNGYLMHQRMGFYTAPNGRLLALGFYAHTPNPFFENGIGRVVREIYKDGSLGPIFFLRYSSHAKWNESNTSYPFYQHATDYGFVEACDSLLADRLYTFQWWDEDKGVDGFYDSWMTDELRKALRAGDWKIESFNYYKRQDGNLVGIWKWSYAALSTDNGKSWSNPQKVPSLIMAGGKNWGQQTADGRYALVYNPVPEQQHRYPLAMISSDDGITFDQMGAVHGEVPPRRFWGISKDFGPNYIRGIFPGEALPPDNNMWLTYSVNKEDIWVSRVPVPERLTVSGDVADNFDNMEVGGVITDWNIYAPQWAPTSVVKFAGTDNQVLKLQDKDPYDYAKAVRVFEQSKKVAISFRVYLEPSHTGALQIEVNNYCGKRPVQLFFADDSKLKVGVGNFTNDLTRFEAQKWYEVKLLIDAEAQTYDLTLNGDTILNGQAFADELDDATVERLTFRTGDHRIYPKRSMGLEANQIYLEPLPGADMPVDELTYYLDDVVIEKIK